MIPATIPGGQRRAAIAQLDRRCCLRPGRASGIQTALQCASAGFRIDVGITSDFCGRGLNDMNEETPAGDLSVQRFFCQFVDQFAADVLRIGQYGTPSIVTLNPPRIPIPYYGHLASLSPP